MNAYQVLARLAKRELELVRAGELDALPALHAEREALLTALPATPPECARTALERAAAYQEQVSALLAERTADAGAELRRISHGRTAIHGYAPQVEHAKLVDRAG
jgi:hypothetical protein